MPFTLACPGCNSKLKATEALVGKTIKCPRCSSPVLIQEPSPTAVAVMPRMELPPSAPVEEPEERDDFVEEEAPEETGIVEELAEVEDAEDEFDDVVAADEDEEEERRPRKKKKIKKRPTGAPTADERTMALFVYLLALFTGFVGPLILWLVKKEESKFIDHHGKEVVNFSLSLFIIAMGINVIGGPLIVMTFGFAVLIVGPMLLALMIYSFVILIIGAMKANNGEWWEFPLTFRMIK